MKKFLWSMILVFFSAILVGCSDTLTTNPPSDEKVEYQITYTNVALDMNSIGTVWVSVIAEVTNTGNTDLYLSSGSFDLEDESGKLVKVISLVSVYPQIISPGEKAYYYDSTTIDNVSENANLSVILQPDIVKSKTDKISFPVTDVEISNREYGGVEAVGRVENTSQEDESMLYIAVILFDSNDKPLLVLFDIEDVKAGVKKGFNATNLGISDDITTASVSRFVAVAYTYQFQF